MKTCEKFKPDMTIVVVNGMLVFGLTTACLFAMTQKVRPQKTIYLTPKLRSAAKSHLLTSMCFHEYSEKGY